MDIWAFLITGFVSSEYQGFPAKPGNLRSLGNIKKVTDIGIKQLYPHKLSEKYQQKYFLTKQTQEVSSLWNVKLYG